MQQHVERPFKSVSDHNHMVEKISPSCKEGGKSAFNCRALKTRNVFPVECSTVLVPLKLVQKEQLVGTCRPLNSVTNMKT